MVELGRTESSLQKLWKNVDNRVRTPEGRVRSVTSQIHGFAFLRVPEDGTIILAKNTPDGIEETSAILAIENTLPKVTVVRTLRRPESASYDSREEYHFPESPEEIIINYENPYSAARYIDTKKELRCLPLIISEALKVSRSIRTKYGISIHSDHDEVLSRDGTRAHPASTISQGSRTARTILHILQKT